MMQTLRDKDVGIISRNLLSYHCKSKYNFNFYIERISTGRSHPYKGGQSNPFKKCKINCSTVIAPQVDIYLMYFILMGVSLLSLHDV